MTNPSSPASDRVNSALRTAAIALWVVLAAIIAVKTVENPENHSTYPLFRDAALAWWEGVNVYDRNVFGGDYRYGPSFAMAMLPLAWLPIRLGALLWAVGNVGVAFWTTVALARRVLPGARSPTAYWLLLMACVFPNVHCLYASQTNSLIFSFVAFAAIAVLDKRWWLAAFLLAIPVHIKIWPAAAGLLFAACWPRRLAWRFPIALVAVAALPLLVKPPSAVFEQYLEWYRHLVGPAQIRHTYRDAWTTWELVSAPVDPRLYAILQLTTAAAVLCLCLWQSFRASPTQVVLCVLASWTSWQLVFGPGTERNTFSLIAPLTSWAMVTALIENRGRWWMGISFGLTIASAIGGVEDIHPWLQVMHPVGISMFFAWFLRAGLDR